MPSFLEELQQIAENVRQDATKTLPVQGAGGKYVVRFRPPPDRDVLTKAVAAYSTVGALSGEDEKQLIVDCCDEILRRNPETGEAEQVEGGPLRFDPSDDRWGSGVKTARECVAKLYNLDVHPLALTGSVEALIDWLQGIDAEIRARVEGKSGSGETSSRTPQPST